MLYKIYFNIVQFSIQQNFIFVCVNSCDTPNFVLIVLIPYGIIIIMKDGCLKYIFIMCEGVSNINKFANFSIICHKHLNFSCCCIFWTRHKALASFSEYIMFFRNVYFMAKKDNLIIIFGCLKKFIFF